MNGFTLIPLYVRLLAYRFSVLVASSVFAYFLVFSNAFLPFCSRIHVLQTSKWKQHIPSHFCLEVVLLFHSYVYASNPYHLSNILHITSLVLFYIISLREVYKRSRARPTLQV
jgi:hypothetical protein